MKRFIAMALCFALAACVMVGCGRTEDKKTTDTTATPTTITTHTTNSAAPITENTIPSISSNPQETPGTNSMPGDGNDNMGENSDNARARSHTHYPTVSSGSR